MCPHDSGVWFDVVLNGATFVCSLCFSFFGRNRKVAAAFVKQKKVRRAVGM
jgi:hypothetical protein